MRLPVENIPRSGFQAKVNVEDSWAREAVEASLEVPAEGLTGEMFIEPPRKGRVNVKIRLSTAGTHRCDRCGASFRLPVEVDESLAYLPVPEGGEPEQELESEEMDVGWYTDGELDLSQVVREGVALALPLRMVCVTDTAGCDRRTEALLGSAGRSGDAGEGHPGFAALKGLLGS